MATNNTSENNAVNAATKAYAAHSKANRNLDVVAQAEHAASFVWLVNGLAGQKPGSRVKLVSMPTHDTVTVEGPTGGQATFAASRVSYKPTAKDRTEDAGTVGKLFG